MQNNVEPEGEPAEGEQAPPSAFAQRMALAQEFSRMHIRSNHESFRGLPWITFSVALCCIGAGFSDMWGLVLVGSILVILVLLVWRWLDGEVPIEAYGAVLAIPAGWLLLLLPFFVELTGAPG